MEKFSILLIIAAIACALFSDKMDLAAKKVIFVFSVGVLSVCTITLIVSILIVNIQTEKLRFIEELPNKAGPQFRYRHFRVSQKSGELRSPPAEFQSARSSGRLFP